MSQDLSFDALSEWSFAKKITFRFLFLFFFLEIFPFPLNAIPIDAVYEYVLKYYDDFWYSLATWTGKTIFHLPEVLTVFNGSGDKTSDWLLLFLNIIIPLIGCIVWSILDRKRKNYAKLSYWLMVAVRYYLGYTMFSYGFAKIFFTQFGNLTTYRLHERFGDMSPMGVLWTFMATSKAFQFFTGMGEFIGGFLILFRRTTLLGALIIITVMSNVVVLNFCYDVPVKIYSVLLLLMAFFIAAPDFQRFMDFFFRNKATLPNNYQLFSEKEWFKNTRIALKIVFIGGFCLNFLVQGYSEINKQEKPLTAFYGPYKVQKFIKNKVDLGISDSDTLRWGEVFIDRRGSYETIALVNTYGLKERLNPEIDFNKHIITLKSRLDQSVKGVFSYRQPDSTSLVLTGIWGKDSLKVELSKTENNFLLTSRGFHWINEVPFNK